MSIYTAASVVSGWAGAVWLLGRAVTQIGSPYSYGHLKNRIDYVPPTPIEKQQSFGVLKASQYVKNIFYIDISDAKFC